MGLLRDPDDIPHVLMTKPELLELDQDLRDKRDFFASMRSQEGVEAMERQQNHVWFEIKAMENETPAEVTGRILLRESLMTPSLPTLTCKAF